MDPAHDQCQRRKNRQKFDARLVAAEHAAEVGHEHGIGDRRDQGKERQLHQHVGAATVPAPDDVDQTAEIRQPDQRGKRRIQLLQEPFKVPAGLAGAQVGRHIGRESDAQILRDERMRPVGFKPVGQLRQKQQSGGISNRGGCMVVEAAGSIPQTE